jgi:ATP-dependent Clp protease ATP-binding subunit ClpA
MSHQFERDALTAATEEARRLGSHAVEAEHLLLALAADEASPSGRLLAEVGLNHDELRAALNREAELSLAAVGVRLADFAFHQATPPARSPGLGASFKRAMREAGLFTVSQGSRDIAGAHLLVGILRAEIGTVPRALAAADVDRSALLTRAEHLVEAERA